MAEKIINVTTNSTQGWRVWIFLHDLIFFMPWTSWCFYHFYHHPPSSFQWHLVNAQAYAHWQRRGVKNHIKVGWNKKVKEVECWMLGKRLVGAIWGGKANEILAHFSVARLWCLTQTHPRLTFFDPAIQGQLYLFTLRLLFNVMRELAKKTQKIYE